jgi:Lactonase, 7-bladed beta-propeller/Abnormal spindle-like microcephaly-assoc'd, ASPM-SPD-2-Hydin
MRPSCLKSPFRITIFAAVLYLLAPSSGQAQAPYLYVSIPGATTSQVAAFSVDSSGALTAVHGSPFTESHEGGMVSTDPADQFLFVVNATSDTISVLSIDQSTGALTEITPAIPAPTFGGATLSNPTCMATFSSLSGSYLYVGYLTGPATDTGAIAAFQIGTPGQTPVLTPLGAFPLEAFPAAIATSSEGYLYAALKLFSGSMLGNQISGVSVFPIDPGSGQLDQPSPVDSNPNEQSLALNPAGTLLFDGWGSATGGVESALILANGLTAAPQTVELSNSNSPPSVMIVDGSGRLLYVEEKGHLAVYLIDPNTGVLTATPSPPTSSLLDLIVGNTVADPVEPYLYTIQEGQLEVLTIADTTTGALVNLGSSTTSVGGASNLTLTHNAANRAPIPFAAQINPVALNFDDTTVGQSSSSATTLLTNTGTQPFNVTSFNLSDPNDFAETPNCPSPLAAGQSCTITVTFGPKTAVTLDATIAVTETQGTQSLMQTIQLTGIGEPASSGGGNPSPTPQPILSLSATSLSFVSSAINATTPAQNLTITNTGSAPLSITNIQLTGPNAADFKLTNDCNQPSYAQSNGCTLSVTFTPSASGSRVAQILISDNASAPTPTIALSGVAASSGGSGGGNPSPPPQPVLTLSATSLSFVSTAINATTPTQYLTIKNTGSAPLSITTIQLTGPNAADFEMTNDCGGPSYSQNNGCTLSVAFTPSASGSRSAQILITDNAPTAVPTIALNGVTATESVTISPGSSDGMSETVLAGETATYNLKVVSTFSGTIFFSPCTGAPATATCTVPSPLPVLANQTTPFSISVATAAATSMSRLKQPEAHRPAGDIFTARFRKGPMLLPLAFAFLILSLLAFRRALRLGNIPENARPFSLPASAVIVTLLALAPFAIAGCGGASTVATAPITTTPTSASQTYTITISLSASTSDSFPAPTVQPINLTLVVN